MFAELQSLFGSSLYSNGPLYQNSNQYDNSALRDNYGYQRGTVDHLGRVIDTMGNPTGFQLNSGKIIDSLGSYIGHLGYNNRISNNLGQDLGLTLNNLHPRFEIKSEPLLPIYSPYHSREVSTKISDFGSKYHCKSHSEIDDPVIRRLIKFL